MQQVLGGSVSEKTECSGVSADSLAARVKRYTESGQNSVLPWTPTPFHCAETHIRDCEDQGVEAGKDGACL